MVSQLRCCSIDLESLEWHEKVKSVGEDFALNYRPERGYSRRKVRSNARSYHDELILVKSAFLLCKGERDLPMDILEREMFRVALEDRDKKFERRRQKR